MERHLLQGSSVMVDSRHVGTLRSLIEVGMAIVEIWVNEAASEELLAGISQIKLIFLNMFPLGWLGL